MRRSIWVTGMLCFFAGSVMADQVTLKNGDRLTGTIVKSDGKTLLIKTEFAGEVNVQSDAVSAMVSSAVAPGFEGWTDDRRDSDSRGQ